MRKVILVIADIMHISNSYAMGCGYGVPAPVYFCVARHTPRGGGVVSFDYVIGHEQWRMKSPLSISPCIRSN